MILLKQPTSIKHIEYCFVKPKIEVFNPIKPVVLDEIRHEMIRALGVRMNKAAKA